MIKNQTHNRDNANATKSLINAGISIYIIFHDNIGYNCQDRMCKTTLAATNANVRHSMIFLVFLVAICSLPSVYEKYY